MVEASSDQDAARDDIGTSVDRPFRDKLLLALIDAHPEPGQQKWTELRRLNRRARRLRDARQAVFAVRAKQGRQHQSDDQALRWMGEQHRKDLARASLTKLPLNSLSGSTVKIRSDRALAKIAAEKFFPFAENAWIRLRSKFSKSRKYWIHVATSHDDVPETVQFQALERDRLYLAALRCGNETAPMGIIVPPNSLPQARPMSRRGQTGLS